jgi:hypothetical protein
VSAALRGRCELLGLHNVEMRLRLFDALVRPVLCFGCEVWGPDWVSPWVRSGNLLQGRAEVQVHVPFVRQALGMPKSVMGWALFTEAGRQPLAVLWLRMAAGLWNKAWGRPQGDFLREAMQENVAQAGQLPQGLAKELWATHFTACLDALQVQWWAEGVGGVRHHLQIDVTALTQALMDAWVRYERRRQPQADWTHEWLSVRAAPASFSTGFKFYVYWSWFAPPESERQGSYTHHLHQPEHIRVLAQFRLGCHWLAIEQGRRARLRVPRAERCCPACPGVVEDEAHLLECPLYAGYAGPFRWEGEATLFDATVHRTFWGSTKEFWEALADFLLFCQNRRFDLLR